jgi:hypothetical protein
MTVGGKLFISSLEVGEMSTTELIESLEFPLGINCVTKTHPIDKAQYWAERTQDSEGRTTSIKLASTAANIFYLNIVLSSPTNGKVLDLYGVKPDGNIVNAPNGEVLSDPYSDPARPIAGAKQLNFFTSFAEGKKIEDHVKGYGYPTYFYRFENGVYSFNILTTKELIGRAKIEEDALTNENWFPVEESTKGNFGLYEYSAPKRMVGEIVANEHTKITRMHEGKKVYDATYSSTSSSSMNYSIERGRLETMQDIEMFNRVITEGVMYGILHGKTLEDALGEPTNIKASGTTEIWNEHEGKLRLTERSTYNAISDGCDWNIAIEPYNTSTNEVPLHALKQTYCVTSMMTGNIRLFTSGGKYKTSGTTTGIRRSYLDELENFSEEFTPQSGITFPEMRDRKPTIDEGLIIEPMVVTNTDELTEYLFNPEGIFTLTVNGKRISDYNGERTEYNTTMTIKMWPEGTPEEE